MGPGSMQLAHIFGIRIGVNASWFLVLFLFIYLLSGSFTNSLGGNQTAGYFAAVAASLLFFGSIVLHELGHALAARREGIGVSGIDLFFFGGLMRMTRDTDSPGAEFRVAAAGPFVTLLIVVVAAIAGVALAGSVDDFVQSATFEGGASASAPELLVSFLVTMNVLLLGLNLVPAFPLDGGRIARAAAWKLTGDRIRATRFSALLGRAFSFALIGYGVLLAIEGALINGIWLAVLGWLLGQAARGAVAQTRLSERLRGATVADVMDAEPVAIPADTPVTRVWDEFFLRYHGWKWFPVIDEHGRPIGIAHRAAVEQVVLESGEDLAVRDVTSDLGSEGTIGTDETLEALIPSAGRHAEGALLAVDDQGRLAGVVTPRRVSRALSSRLA